MKNANRILASLAALMLGTVPVLSAFAEAPAEVPAEAPAEVAAEATPAFSMNDIMVTVNGQPIIRAEVMDFAQYLYNYYSQQGYSLDDEESQAMLVAMAIRSSVTMAVETQKAAELGLNYENFTDEEKAAIETEVNETWESLINQYTTYYLGGIAEDATEEQKLQTRTAAIAGLEGMGYTQEMIRNDLSESAVYDRLYAIATEGATVTDADVEAAFAEAVEADRQQYEGNIFMYEFYTQYYGQESFYTPEGYRGITHILLQVDEDLLNTYSTLAAKLEEQEQAVDAEPTTDEATPETLEAPVTQEAVDAAYDAVIASVQDTIDAIYAALDNGTSFDDLITEYCTDPGMTDPTNRANGYSVHAESVLYDPAFVKAAFSVDHVGDVAQPVVGSYGVHIVKYQRDVPSGAVELTDELRAKIAESLQNEVTSNAFSAAMDTWMHESVISYSDEAAMYLSLLEE